jgi:tRNA pseudouridine55 synthase
VTRRGATDLAGVLPLDKPSGMTSHDVVAAIRKATGEGRVGHAGTLDPMATGLLVVLIGPYTRLEPFLSGTWKSYEARIAFGTSTDTDDTEGEIVDVAAVPSDVFETHHAQNVLDTFLGPSCQTPPAYSAIKVGGRIAHRAARAGEALELKPRPVEIDTAELLRADADARTWDVRFRVSKGTYVRSLARDIGRACGTVATLSALRRTAAGLLTLDDASDLETATMAGVTGILDTLFVSAVAALGLPVVEASTGLLRDGRALPADLCPSYPDGALTSVMTDGRLHGVYRRSGDLYLPVAVVGGTGS